MAFLGEPGEEAVQLYAGARVERRESSARPQSIVPVHSEDVVDAADAQALSVQDVFGLNILHDGHAFLHRPQDFGLVAQLRLDRIAWPDGDAQSKAWVMSSANRCQIAYLG